MKTVSANQGCKDGLKKFGVRAFGTLIARELNLHFHSERLLAQPLGQRYVTIASKHTRRWHCAARREITRPKEGKLPEQKTRSPRKMTEDGKPLKANPREWRYTTAQRGRPGGVQRGPRRGGSP